MKIPDLSLREWAVALKGLATYIGPLNRYRQRTRTGGGHTGDPAYCYSVWLRNICVMRKFGWHPERKTICELGPGDSIGVGIAALLSGAESYLGLDWVPAFFSMNKDGIIRLIRGLAELCAARCPIPGPDRYPRIRPELESYEFPTWLFSGRDSDAYVRTVMGELISDVEEHDSISRIHYIAPYENVDMSPYAGSFDGFFSQAVLEHVNDIARAYGLAFELLKPGGWSWHVIDFRSHCLSAAWNGHWRYPEWLWKMALGRREFFLNRLPLSDHLDLAAQAGFRVEAAIRYEAGENPSLAEGPGLDPESFAYPFSRMSPADASTAAAMLVLKKP